MSEAAVPGGSRGSRAGAGVARMLSDDRLARRASGGDERAFAAIYRRYHQSLYRFCLAIVGNRDDAQDALQNTMIKAMRALPGEERQIELKPWLYRVAHNESVELLRRRRETAQLDSDLAVQRPGPAEESALRERLRRLISDLDELPERQRGALVMRELAGLGFEEIGAALGTSPAVARQTLYEARLSLRQMDAGREMSCDQVTRALSDADGRVTRRRDIRAHLRGCASCRSFRDAIGDRQRDLAAISPLPAVAAAGLLHGLLGSHGGSGGVATALSGGVAKSLGATAMVKSAATVAVVAAVGVGVADYGGAVHVGLPGDGGPQSSRSSAPAGVLGPAGRPAGRAALRTGAGEGGAALGRSAARIAASRRAKAARGGDNASVVGGRPNPAALPGSAADRHPGGHEKALPSASAHGQETAATHRASHHSRGHRKEHPSPPPRPPHPSQPSNSGAKATPPPPHESSQKAPQVTDAAPPPPVEEAAPSEPTETP